MSHQIPLSPPSAPRVYLRTGGQHSPSSDTSTSSFGSGGRQGGTQRTQRLVVKAHREQNVLGASSDLSFPRSKTTKPRALGMATGWVSLQCNRALDTPAGPPCPTSSFSTSSHLLLSSATSQSPRHTLPNSASRPSDFQNLPTTGTAPFCSSAKVSSLPCS